MKNVLLYLIIIGLAVIIAGEPGYFERVTGIDPDPFLDDFIFWLFTFLLSIPFLLEWRRAKGIPKRLSRKASLSLIAFLLILALIIINPVLTDAFHVNILGSLRPFLYIILFIGIIYDAVKSKFLFSPEEKKTP